MIDIEKGTGNVYADLDLPNADEMLVKAQLATKIAEIIKSWRMLPRLTQPRSFSRVNRFF